MFAEHLVSVISSPQQQVSAVLASRDFLLRLTQGHATPRVPREVRREALALLRHFPPPERIRSVLEEGLKDQREPSTDPLTERYGLL